jgi:hypothetical protein
MHREQLTQLPAHLGIRAIDIYKPALTFSAAQVQSMVQFC